MIVQKYGGSSVSTLEKIIAIAKNIKTRLKQEKKIVVVVSAMGKRTNELIEQAKAITTTPNERELDSLLAVGEQQSASLLAIALNSFNVKSISLNAHQAKIRTTDNFQKALITDIDSFHILKLLKTFDCLVITGFQGEDQNENTTTLGRGGSDTTAVALASVLKWDCEIYTDVSGVFSINPEKFEKAKKLDFLSYDQALEMASNGAKVLDERCLEIAKKYNTKIYLGKSLENDHTKGTYVMQTNFLEKVLVTNVSTRDNVVFFQITKKDISQIIKSIKNSKQNLEMFSIKDEKISFICKKSEQKTVENALKSIKNLKNIKVQDGFCKITLVGFGFSTHPEILENLFTSFEKHKIKIYHLIQTETIISFLIKQQKEFEVIKILTPYL